MIMCRRALLHRVRVPGPPAVWLQSRRPGQACCRPSSTLSETPKWRSIGQLPSSDLARFAPQFFELGIPTRLAHGTAHASIEGSWIKTEGSTTELDLQYLRKYADSLYLPMEMTVGPNSFHRADAVPLSIFLDSLQAANSAIDRAPRIYIAQCPLNRLPEDLAAPFAIPDLVRKSGRGDVYNSSLWLGLAPTSTPLHRDPNPNLFMQVAGQKILRLMPPDYGSQLYHRIRQGREGGEFSADERIRGEEMMKGDEKRLLEEAVWGPEAGDGTHLEGFEAFLQPGESLFIPQGWWHAVRGVGTGINMSVNWWFR